MNIAEKILRAKADYDAVFEAGKKAVGEVLKFTDVASTAYRSIVPNGVEPFAKVNKIGGMSYKTRNLLPRATRNSQTSNGLTFTVQDDNSIIVNGTATATTAFEILRGSLGEKIPLNKGETYTLSGCPKGGSMDSYRLVVQDVGYSQTFVDIGDGATSVANYGEYYVFIRFYAGATANNLVFRPMLNKGTTALPYEPYFEGLRSASVGELKSEGANFIPFPYSYESKSDLGLTATANSDGSIRISGTATEIGRFTPYFFVKYPLPNILPEGTYSMPIMDGAGWKKYRIRVTFFNENLVEFCNLLNEAGENTKTVTEKTHYISLNFDYWTTAVGEEVDITFYPMLNVGTTTLPFTKYKGDIDTLAIPEAVKSLAGYGLGVNAEYYNYIDFERKVFVQNVYRKVFDGTEDWYIPSSIQTTYFQSRIPFAPLSYNAGIMGDYNHASIGGTGSSQGWYLLESGFVRIRPDIELYPRREDWKAYLAERYANGNPLVIDYALAEPIETDISAYLTDEYIEVEGGGTITAVNEYGYDVPTNISYLTDTQGG